VHKKKEIAGQRLQLQLATLELITGKLLYMTEGFDDPLNSNDLLVVLYPSLNRTTPWGFYVLKNIQL